MGFMQTAIFFIAFVVAANVGCILSFGRAQQALRDLGATWVRALGGRRVGSSHSA
jgi:hypothetical protein